MNPYMFVFKAIPLPTNQNFEMVAGANVHIWVIDKNIKSAVKRAIDYVNKYLWEVQSIEHEFEITQEQIDSLHTLEAQLYNNALLNGISADFLAWPNIEGDPSDPVIFGKA